MLKYLMLAFLTSCTYTITLVDTEGQATDVVDETSTNAPKVAPSLSVPVMPH